MNKHKNVTKVSKRSKNRQKIITISSKPLPKKPHMIQNSFRTHHVVYRLNFQEHFRLSVTIFGLLFTNICLFKEFRSIFVWSVTDMNILSSKSQLSSLCRWVRKNFEFFFPMSRSREFSEKNWHITLIDLGN